MIFFEQNKKLDVARRGHRSSSRLRLALVFHYVVFFRFSCALFVFSLFSPSVLLLFASSSCSSYSPSAAPPSTSRHHQRHRQSHHHHQLR
ncbi:Uncharacterized protein APZ42_024367 [Daphnia magna]|uniref:Uncharacterized protein n=1 Tax=Daphnia magna TaxID=35525 RepID=A0A0P5QGS6_9CRUS|nr:Uncharacterized protein APZ42_024367 [Daphnia magna]